MDREKFNSRINRILWAAAVAVLTCSALIYLVSTDQRSGLKWERYYSVVTSDAMAVEIILSQSEVPYYSLNNSSVEYNDISGMKSICLSSLSEQFDPLDPRFDPFMKAASMLFQGEIGDDLMSIVYVPVESISLYSLCRLLLPIPKGGDYSLHIGGVQPLRKVLPLLLFSVFSLIFIFFSRGDRSGSIIRLIGWVPGVVIFSMPLLPIAATALYLFQKKRSLTLYAIYSSFIILYASLFTDSPLSLLLFSGVGILASLFPSKAVEIVKKASAVKEGRTLRNRIRFGKPEHQLFSPVPIMGSIPVSAPPSGTPTFIVKYLSVAAIVGFLVLFVLMPKSPELYIPVIEEQTDLQWSLESLENTADHGKILSPADYITHLSYQEGFLFGAEWNYPEEGSFLRYPVFEQNEKGFSKKYEYKAQYSEKWYQDRISLLNNNNPAKLLFSTLHPGFVIKKPVYQNSEPILLLNISFSMLLLLLLIFCDEKIVKIKPFLARKKLLRRNEQVA